jgi:hypothetical protein
VNWQRGLFRAWLLISGLWIAGASVIAVIQVSGAISGESDLYVATLREGQPWQQTGSEPFYKLHKSPREDGPPEFSKIGYRYLSLFREDAKVGLNIVVKMPDSSTLYLDAALTSDDRDFVSHAFWDQRWFRWREESWRWMLGILLPPVFLLLIGYALLWTLKGFKQ